MNKLPDLVEIESCSGKDYVEKFKSYIELLYKIYLETVVNGNLSFRGMSVRCRFMPETYGKHFAFWHIIQEGKIEDERHPDLARCKRILWISWVIKNAEQNKQIRVFLQSHAHEKESWILWLYKEDYAVVLHKRNNYFLLKTAFIVKPHKRREFERDWQKASSH